jgi:hypothetical protein
VGEASINGNHDSINAEAERATCALEKEVPNMLERNWKVSVGNAELNILSDFVLNGGKL